MDEYIKKEAVLRAYEEVQRRNGTWRFEKLIESVPTEDVAPVRHARWVDNHCTACGMMPMGDEMWKRLDLEPPLFERFMDYCPICGAYMRQPPKGE